MRCRTSAAARRLQCTAPSAHRPIACAPLCCPSSAETPIVTLRIATFIATAAPSRAPAVAASRRTRARQTCRHGRAIPRGRTGTTAATATAAIGEQQTPCRAHAASYRALTVPWRVAPSVRAGIPIATTPAKRCTATQALLLWGACATARRAPALRRHLRRRRRRRRRRHRTARHRARGCAPPPTTTLKMAATARAALGERCSRRARTALRRSRAH